MPAIVKQPVKVPAAAKPSTAIKIVLPTRPSRMAKKPTDYVMMFFGPPGVGKCLGKDTPILMFDGHIKLVQDVKVGDQLMGPDSKPRLVGSLARGREELFQVTPVKGDPYVVNKSHILSLKTSPKHQGEAQKIVNLPLTEYLASSNTRKHHLKGWRSAVEWEEQPVPVDPYFLGIWLGDGTSESTRVCVNDLDEEIIDKLREYADELGLNFNLAQIGQGCKSYRIAKGWGKQDFDGNALLNSLRAINVIGNKHIPRQYFANSREVRLKLLAGLIDSDGSLSHNSYCITQKRKKLAEDIRLLALSLGFYASIIEQEKSAQNGVVGTYWRVTISGDTDVVPLLLDRKRAEPRKQKKDVTVTGLCVESIGDGDYYGFTIDGDHLFMLGDFTVTHNTTFVDEMTNHRTLFISTDRGTRFRDMMRLECHNWDKIEATIKELERDPTNTKALYDAVCIDHVDDAANMLEDKVCNDLHVEALGDAGFGKGWKAYRRGIERIVHRIMRLGLGVIFIAHEDIKTVETRISKVDRTMPSLQKTAWKVIVPLADIIGFCGYKTLKTDSGRKEIRTLETSPREDLYVKDRTDRVKPAKGWEVLDPKKFVATFPAN